MSPYLVGFTELVWAWVLAPPLHWAISLRLEWQIELSVLALLCAFHRPLIEYFFVGRDVIGDWREDRKWKRDWNHFGKMSHREFLEVRSRIRELARKEDERAFHLRLRARRGFVGSVLQKAASRRADRAKWLRDEADRIKSLWDRLEAERRAENLRRQSEEFERQRREWEERWQREDEERQQREEEERLRREQDERRRKTNDDHPGMRGKVLALMRKLESGNDWAAAGALSELNGIRASFDWESLAPVGIAPAQRKRLVNILMLMAGTTSLGEARNALRSARVILEQNHCDWQWEPA
jgi:hypothetical protein